MQLFAHEQEIETSDDFYTPAWVFEMLDLEFDMDVASPPGGLPWIPAARSLSMADDGLTYPWKGRVWMNPPFSNPAPWAVRFVEHGNGVALLPAANAWWSDMVWDRADGFAIPRGAFYFLGVAAQIRGIAYRVFLVAMGSENDAPLSVFGRVR